MNEGTIGRWAGPISADGKLPASMESTMTRPRRFSKAGLGWPARIRILVRRASRSSRSR